MDFLTQLDIEAVNSGSYCGTWLDGGQATITSIAPATGQPIAEVREAIADEYERVSRDAHAAFLRWREIPAPARGEYVRRIGTAMRELKEPLGELVSWESGKIREEGLGEIQECIDIADFAVGLSRQLYGLTMPSERPQHSMRETWHPLGTVGIITAFNFPAAVWAWNSMLSLVCGDSNIWKPSPKTPLIALAMTKVAASVLEPDGFGALVSLVVGDRDPVGTLLVEDKRVPLISATGSVRMGREVAASVGARLGKTILELGGNNALIVMDDADLEMAVRSILFGAVGTAGQRCTTTRRVFAHEGIIDQLQERLVTAYAKIAIGSPLEPGTLMGPLIDEDAIAMMMDAIERATAQGGEVLCGGKRAALGGELAGGSFVEPTIVRARADMELLQEETFAPLLYIAPIRDIEEAITAQNNVPQGLSSSIFTLNARDAERFLSTVGSDCGIANVNIGTSGAEIGGAFGGEKDTGGGRESGSDAWKAYMRRQTSTVNWGTELPLAQGIQFGE